MKILVFHIIFICAAVCANAQNDTINQLDEEGDKQGWWIYYGKDRPESGYPAEGKIEEGNYKDSRKHGIWIRYYSDGKTMKLKGEYKNNRPNGRYWKYHENGTLKETAIFTRNRFTTGPKEEYFDNGQLKQRTNYNQNGQKIDTTYSYFESGCLNRIQIHIMIGEESKPVVEYFYSDSPDSCNTIVDTIISDEVTNCGGRNPRIYPAQPTEMIRITKCSELRVLREIEGRLICLNQNDEVVWDGTCKDDKLWSGKQFFYDGDGILLKIEVWEEGKYVRDGQL